MALAISGLSSAPSEWLRLGLNSFRQIQKYQGALLAAFDNAQSLHREGRTLFQSGAWGRAAALGVTGYEEAGKVVAYHLLVIGHVKAESAEALLRILQRDHRMKQVLAHVARLIGDMARRVRPVVDGLRFSHRSTLDDVKEAFRSLSPEIIAAVTSLPDGAKIEETVRSISEAGSLEDLKHRGLYVDLADDGALSIPAGVTRKQANEVLSGLWWSLRGVSVLRPAAQLTPEGLALIRGWIQEPEFLEKLEGLTPRSA